MPKKCEINYSRQSLWVSRTYYRTASKSCLDPCAVVPHCWFLAQVPTTGPSLLTQTRTMSFSMCTSVYWTFHLEDLGKIREACAVIFSARLRMAVVFLFSKPEGICPKRSMRKLPCGRRTCFAYQNSSIFNFPIIYPTFRPQDARNKHENERQVLRIAAQLHFPSWLGDDQENRWNMLGSCRKKKQRFVQKFGPTRLVYGRYGESDVFFWQAQHDIIIINY